MSETTEKIVYICTYGGEDPERATFPFMLANASLAMDVEVTMVLQGNGVWLAKKDYALDVRGNGLPPLADLMQTFNELEGKIMVCTPCIKSRNIEEADLVANARPVAGGAVNEALLAADAAVTY